MDETDRFLFTGVLLLSIGSQVKATLITDCGPGTFYENGRCVTGSSGTTALLSGFGSSFVAPSVDSNSYPVYFSSGGSETCINGACFPGSTGLTNANTGYYCVDGRCYSSSSSFTNPGNGYYCVNGVCYQGNSGNTGVYCTNGVCYSSGAYFNNNPTVCVNGNCFQSNTNNGAAYCVNGVCYSSSSSTPGVTCSNGVCYYTGNGILNTGNVNCIDGVCYSLNG